MEDLFNEYRRFFHVPAARNLPLLRELIIKLKGERENLERQYFVNPKRIIRIVIGFCNEFLASLEKLKELNQKFVDNQPVETGEIHTALENCITSMFQYEGGKSDI